MLSWILRMVTWSYWQISKLQVHSKSFSSVRPKRWFYALKLNDKPSSMAYYNAGSPWKPVLRQMLSVFRIPNTFIGKTALDTARRRHDDDVRESIESSPVWKFIFFYRCVAKYVDEELGLMQWVLVFDIFCVSNWMRECSRRLDEDFYPSGREASHSSSVLDSAQLYLAFDAARCSL